MTLTDDQLERYARHIALKDVGGPGQQKLLKSKVLVIGAGGLGSPVLMYLAAAGVGTLGVVDDDEVTLSNLQRQIIHGTGQVGAKKTDSAGRALAALNPDVNVNLHPVRLDGSNANKIIRDYDVIADGCDNFETRLAINETCVKLKKPLVSAALMQFEGQLSTFRPFDRDAAGHSLPCYRCLVGSEPQGSGLACAEVGILGAVAGVLGTLQATEVLKELLGIGESLAGMLLIYDGLKGEFRKIKLPRDPACPVCAGA